MKLSREEIANIEIGHTEVSRAVQWGLTLSFLALIVLYPVCQFCMRQPFAEWRNAGTVQSSIKAYETAIEDTSLLRQWFLAPAQRFLTGALKTGNEKVIVGRDGWLFYSGDCEYLINPGFLRADVLRKRERKGVQPDPVKAVLDFDRQLKARGIRLILMPVPVKPMVYADMLGGDRIPVQNPSFAAFRKQMETAGVPVVDLAGAFGAMRKAGREPYLKTDTHWTPEGMLLAARKLADRIGAAAVPAPVGAIEVTNLGDIAAMLKLPDCERFFPAETVKVPQFQTKTDRKSDVLLLGDSFANIYSLSAMNWGENGGLAEALGHHLGKPVDAILRNDAGAFATRQLLANELKRGRDRLEGKKVVVWEFAIRELANGDWKMLDMTPGKAPESAFLTVTEPRTVTATVLAATAVPRPHSAPYSDHVMSLHLGDIDGGDAQALVYTVSMRNNVWTAAPKLRVGDTVTVRLSPWAEQEKQYGSWNRSEFEDETLILQEPLYGELK